MTYLLCAVPVATMSVPGWELAFGQNDHEFHDIGFYIWLVTDGTTLGLIDTGLPLDADERAALEAANCEIDPRCAFRDVRTIDAVLADLGASGADIDFVAITQTITYHTGGLDAALLPKAQVYLSRAGVAEFLGEPPGHPPARHYFTLAGWVSLRQFALDGRLHCVDEPTEIAPGLSFETTGGHHPGSAGLKIATDDGLVGLLETAFVDSNVTETRPIGIAENVAQARAVTRRYVRECRHVVAVHEPANASRYPVAQWTDAREGRR